MVKIIRCLTNPVTVSLWDGYFSPSQINNDISTTKKFPFNTLSNIVPLLRDMCTWIYSLHASAVAFYFHSGWGIQNPQKSEPLKWPVASQNKLRVEAGTKWAFSINSRNKHGQNGMHSQTRQLNTYDLRKDGKESQTGSLKWCKITFMSVCQFILHFNG